MNYIFEAILVGIYTCLLYMLFSLFINNFYVLLLVVGFSKPMSAKAFKRGLERLSSLKVPIGLK